MSIVLTFKNYYLESISKALRYPNQNFQVGRAKMRIVKLLEEKSKVLNDSRLEMLTALSEKEENGTPKMKNVMVQKNPDTPPVIEKQYDLTPENLAKFNDEYTAMMKEDCLIDVPDSLRNDLSIFKGLLANSQSKNLLDADIVIIEEALEAMEKKEASGAEGSAEADSGVQPDIHPAEAPSDDASEENKPAPREAKTARR